MLQEASVRSTATPRQRAQARERNEEKKTGSVWQLQRASERGGHVSRQCRRQRKGVRPSARPSPPPRFDRPKKFQAGRGGHARRRTHMKLQCRCRCMAARLMVWYCTEPNPPTPPHLQPDIPLLKIKTTHFNVTPPPTTPGPISQPIWTPSLSSSRHCHPGSSQTSPTF